MLEFKKIDLDQHAQLCVQHRWDAFSESFGADSSQWPEVFHPQDYLRWLEKKSQKSSQGFLHLWLNQQIVGQLEMGLRRSQPHIGHLHFFYLCPAFRGKGLAPLAHQYVKDFFLSQQMKKSQLFVSEKNQRAISFYLKMGWQDQGPRPEFPQLRTMIKTWA